MKLLVTLGQGLEPSPHGDMVVVDWAQGTIVDRFRYQHRVYAQTHKGIAGAWRRGGVVFATTEAELLTVSLAPLRLEDVRTFPFLNDVHHVAATADRLWVCNSGLDTVEEFDIDWTHRSCHDLVAPFGRRPGHVWRILKQDARKSWWRMNGHYEFYTHLTERPAFRNLVKFARPGAYRHSGRDLRHVDYRPHVVHPNHLLPVGDDVWVTLFSTGRIVSLRQGQVVAAGLGHPHDGFIEGEQLLVTDCSRNRVIVQSVGAARGGSTGSRQERVVTGRIDEGFLRGIVAAGDQIYVGLTARRGAPLQYRSARIRELRRDTLEPIREWTVPSELGRQVFSLIDVSDAYRA